ncbi:MAG: SGNH/GDSL hydrolase family protein [Solirubrobacterales bacterium]
MIRSSRLVRDVCLGMTLLAAAGCGGSKSSSTSSSSQAAADFDFGSNNPMKVTAFGDSITQGFLELKRRDLRLITGNNYPNQLQGQLRGLDPAWTVVNRGVGGEETAPGLGRLPSVLAIDKSGFVLIMEGANDATECLDANFSANNLRQMVQIAKASKAIPIIGTGTPNFRNDPCGQDVSSKISVLVRGIASAENIALAETYNGMNDRSLFGISPDRDPLHPNERGYRVMADIWFQAMLQAIPGGTTTALRRRR